MPKQASPYLQRLSSILTRRLGSIVRTERDKQATLTKAGSILKQHFNLVVKYTERKVRLKHKLTVAEKTKFVDAQVADALTDFKRILDDRRQ